MFSIIYPLNLLNVETHEFHVCSLIHSSKLIRNEKTLKKTRMNGLHTGINMYTIYKYMYIDCIEFKLITSVS